MIMGKFRYWNIVLLSLLMVLSSCATKTKIEYVDREVVKYNTIVQHDTLIQNTHDSIYHTIYQKGDTVYDTKYIEKTRWRDKVVVMTDTCYRDSVSTQIKECVVEKLKTPKWCYFSLGISIIFVIFAIGKFVKWLQVK